MPPVVEELRARAGSGAVLRNAGGPAATACFSTARRPGSRLGRYSFVMADPWPWSAAARRRDACRGRSSDRPAGVQTRCSCVRELLAPHRADPIEGLPPFQGGAAGYIGYDWGLTLERLPAPRFDDLSLDDVVIGLYDWVLAWDHVAGKAWLISTGIPERGEARAARAAARAAEVLARLGVLAAGRYVAAGLQTRLRERRTWPRVFRPASGLSRARHRSPSRAGGGTVCRCARRSPGPPTSRRSRACASTSTPATSSRPISRSGSRRRCQGTRGRSTARCAP